MFKNKDGSWSRALVPTMDKSALVGENCDQKQSAYYEHCTGIDNCTDCNLNEMCSWCPVDNKCNVKLQPGCDCPNICLSGLIPDHSCKEPYTLKGEIRNVAPDSKGMRTAEIVGPKVKTTSRKYEIIPGESQILVGYKPERVKMTFHKRGLKNQYNQLSSEWTTYNAP